MTTNPVVTKEKKCLMCDNKILCECFEVDMDEAGIGYCCSNYCLKKLGDKIGADFEEGQYNGHYATCEFGGMFREKWEELRKSAKVWQELAERYSHQKHEIIRAKDEQFKNMMDEQLNEMIKKSPENQWELIFVNTFIINVLTKLEAKNDQNRRTGRL